VLQLRLSSQAEVKLGEWLKNKVHQPARQTQTSRDCQTDADQQRSVSWQLSIFGKHAACG
jgi:hypothetical protein